jgi:hypothetical protein
MRYKWKMADDRLIIGTVKSRTCPTCGHHEVGFISHDGVFYPLRDGDVVQVLDGSALTGSHQMHDDFLQAETSSQENILDHMAVWVPAPLRNDKVLRCKYGVFYDRELIDEEMSSAVYEVAYKRKIQYLIEKERYTPLPVILDEFFGAPNLATGEPEEIAQSLWDELDEIRTPARSVCDWIDNKNKENLMKMIQPRVMEEMENDAVSDGDIKNELTEITLQDFFETLF